MKQFAITLALWLAAVGTARAQTPPPFSFYIHDTTGTTPDTPLPAIYQVASTAVGNSTPTVIKMVNTSSNTVNFILALVAPGASSSARNPNFSVTGLFQDEILSPGASVLYVVNFAPAATGAITGYFNVAYQIEQNGCQVGTSTNACPGVLYNVSTFNGSATAPQLLLSYQSASGPVTLLPSSASPLNFPNTSLSATSTFTFTLTNPTTVDTPAPAITLPVINTNAPSAFTLNTSSVPATITAGSSANFTVTFAPSQTGLANGVLQIASDSFPIQGAGIIVAGIDALQISYTDSTGVRTLPQAATPISFGQVIPGTASSAILTFSVTNPTTSYNPVTVPSITVTGAAFTLTGAPTSSVAIAPGNTITFTLSFTPPSSGSFTGTLAIGSRSFILNGISSASPIPSISLSVGAPLSSQQQASVTIQLSAPSPVSAVGTISMAFAPSVANVTDDPAVAFLAGGRELSITINSGAQTAAYQGQTAIGFQTGTTAGSITFSVAFANAAVYTQSFTIPPSASQLVSAQAIRESPNLLVTLSGYDNTYSTGALSFTFYDTTGKQIGSPIQINAASNFQQLFFSNNTGGGLFSLQASFPVSGEVTQVGSVSVGLTNSQGQSTTSATFQ